LILEYNNFSFATDPWALGPAFSNGWWLKKKTKEDWLEKINDCDFIYISHNHPDHLHPHTLKKISKKMKFIIPKFISGSTKVLLEDLNFKNIDEFELNHEYKCKNNDLNLCILKSGDFREDSGLYFSIGNFTSLLNVDSNSINFNRLPNTTFYASSFGGGASGYPLMFDNYKTIEKKKIIIKNRNFHKILQQKNLNLIKPKYFFPYASFFEERLERDKMIKKLNKKNDIKSYENFCTKKKIRILDTEKNDLFTFSGEDLVSEENVKVKFYKDKNTEDYLHDTKKNYNKLDENYVKNYFLLNQFKHDLLLFVSLINDDFKNSISHYIIDFSKKKISFIKTSSSELYNYFRKKTSLNKLYLKIRYESFLYVIYNKLPWEDLLIGFQCKVLRTPNIYNANFWFHFTNNYVSSKRVVSKIKCNSCSILEQKIDIQISKNKI
jgi:CMP-N-acetylneuraminate monooxygenase